MMAESPCDVKSMLDICAAVMKKLGLSAKKTTVVQLAGKLAEDTVLRFEEDVPHIASSLKYLGINLCSGPVRAPRRQTREDCPESILRLWRCNDQGLMETGPCSFFDLCSGVPLGEKLQQRKVG